MFIEKCVVSVVVQADFIVPSSREAVDCDSAWNELLREQVPNLFLQALQSFKQLTPPAAHLPMAWLNRWLQSIPLPREVTVSVHILKVGQQQKAAFFWSTQRFW